MASSPPVCANPAPTMVRNQKSLRMKPLFIRAQYYERPAVSLPNRSLNRDWRLRAGTETRVLPSIQTRTPQPVRLPVRTTGLLYTPLTPRYKAEPKHSGPSHSDRGEPRKNDIVLAA